MSCVVRDFSNIKYGITSVKKSTMYKDCKLQLESIQTVNLKYSNVEFSFNTTTKFLYTRQIVSYFYSNKRKLTPKLTQLQERLRLNQR